MTPAEQYIKQNKGLIIGLCNEFTMQRETHEDLCQVAKLAIVDAWAAYTLTRAKPSTYFRRCMRNRVLNALRKTHRETLPIDHVSLRDAITTCTALDAETMALGRIQVSETDVLIARVLKSLEPNERFIVIHSYGLFGELEKTQREVARSLGCSREWVRQLHASALAKLAKQELLRNILNE